MPFTYNGKEVEKVTYNGKEVQKVEYNGTTVWEAGQWYPVQIEILTSPEYTYENVAPFTGTFNLDYIQINSQLLYLDAMYNRTRPKKLFIEGKVTFKYGSSTVTESFSKEWSTSDGFKAQDLVSISGGATLNLSAASGSGTYYLNTYNVDSEVYATNVEITTFNEYR